MEIRESVASLVIQMYGLNPVRKMMKKIPDGAKHVAVSRNKFASIFYKDHLGDFEADYQNGHGWTSVRQATLCELEQDLHAVSFMLIGIDDLIQELSLHPESPELHDTSLANTLNGLIETQITRAQMRNDADPEQGCWKGHLEAYAIIQNAIRPYL